MDNLITHLRAAKIGNNVLDREVAEEFGIQWSPDEEGNFGGYNILPRRCWFTRKLDAAFVLIPKGWAWRIEYIGEIGDKIFHPTVDLWVPGQRTMGLEVERVQIETSTLPLAVCIASAEAVKLMRKKDA